MCKRGSRVWGNVVTQRFGTVIKLKAECETLYRQYHAAVWPEVLQKIRECNIENYSIFLKNDLLFAYFEYRGDDIKSDLEKMASDPKTQEWWAITGPMQEPLPDRKTGEWWATMDEVFHLE
jgi:L-rhamnose mutarotase